MRAVFEIIFCFFAVIGVYAVVTSIFDYIVTKNAPSKSSILIQQCTDDNETLEYLIRYYESRIINGEFSCVINGILISPHVNADTALIEKLNLEFGNISFLKQ